MKIREILQKQGEIYKNLTSNKIIREYNETIKPNLVLYRNNWIPQQEYKAMKGIEELVGTKPVIVDEPSIIELFEISIKNYKITYLRIEYLNIKEIPEEINNLRNLQRLNLSTNKIQEIKNLDNLTNLEILDLNSNEIIKIKKSEIKSLNKLQNLAEVRLYGNPILEGIKGIKEERKLRKKGIKVHP